MAYLIPSDIGQMVDQVSIIASRLQPVKDIQTMVTKKQMVDKPSKSIEFTAVLPIPNTITDSYQHTWNVTAGITEEVEGSIGGQLSNMGFNSGKKFAARAGFTIDPQHLQTYEGTLPRSFDMEWAFVPKNSGEANTIRDMIKAVKKASAGEKTGGMFLKSPCVWTLIFSGSLNDMLQFKDLVVTNVAVNYTGGGYADFFHDSFPKQVNLALSFAELEPMFKADWE
jgi:hypothetical protein